MVINGRKIADGILSGLKGKIAKIKRPPYLAAVLVAPVPCLPAGRRYCPRVEPVTLLRLDLFNGRSTPGFQSRQIATSLCYPDGCTAPVPKLSCVEPSPLETLDGLRLPDPNAWANIGLAMSADNNRLYHPDGCTAPVPLPAGRQAKLSDLSANGSGIPVSSSRKFLELKKKAAEDIGIDFRIYEFPENISNGELRKKLNQITKATTCGGMIIELPLPAHLNTQYILNTIPERKDPDVLSQKSQGAFFVGRSEILPPSVEAVKTIFEKHKFNPKSKTAAIFGYGLLVGRPISHWLAGQGATVNVINEFTPNPAEFSQQADIIISGVGRPGLVKGDMVKEGAVVIDFGFSGTEKGVVGDVDFETVSRRASLITPVPGGIGPLVIASLLYNFYVLISAGR